MDSDKPINPIISSIHEDHRDGSRVLEYSNNGLTRQELYRLVVMQALLSNPVFVEDRNHYDIANKVKEVADYYLKALEE